MQVEKTIGKKFELYTDEVYYISEVYKDSDEKLKVFFELADSFFKEIKKHENPNEYFQWVLWEG